MTTPRRPNILVFMTDDHGQWASSAYGNSEIQSPAMQWLADTGVRMNEAFCPTPVCSPARASFHTGRLPSRHGIHDWLKEPDEDPNHPGLTGQPTLATYLKEAGYRTGMVGKWHCGKFREPQPGWDTWFTSALGTNARFGKQIYYEGPHQQTFYGHQETILTDRAVRFLKDAADRAQEEPFYLFVGFTNTHTPHSGESDPIVRHYRKCSFRDIPVEPHLPVHGHARIAPFDPRKPERREQLAQYYAAVHAIDQQIIRILAELENLGQLDNTLILYTADHGHMNGHHGLHTKGNATTPVNFLDESIRVPLLLRWPEKLPASATPSFPVDHCDVFATLLEVAGMDAAATTAQTGSPGTSFLRQLTGESSAETWRQYQICEYAYSRMIRTADAKLIRRFPTRVADFPDEFYHLASDPRETCNRFDDPVHADTIRELDAVMTKHFQLYADPDNDGTRMENLRWHNPGNPWEERPDGQMHRQ